MERSLADRITDPALYRKLDAAGYDSVKDIKDAGVIQVIEELHLTEKEVGLILGLVHGGQIRASQTAEDRLKADTQKSGISFSCEALDTLFGTYKGLLPSCITEFCGELGTGKTQLCMQLAINAQFQNGQALGECIYIDTEGSMFPGRLRQIAQQAAKANGLSDEIVDSLLRRIHLFRVFDHFELVALVRQLPIIISELVNVKLVILDSVAFPMRLNVSDSRLRNSLLGFIGQNLTQLASRHDVSVVVTNHVSMDRINSALTPALGPAWGNWCLNRIFLYRKRERRFAYYYKSSLGSQDQTVQFHITDKGLENAINPTLRDTTKDEDDTQLYKPLPISWNKTMTASTPESEKDSDDQDMWSMEHFTDQIVSQLPTDDNTVMQESKEDGSPIGESKPGLKRKRDDELSAPNTEIPDDNLYWSSDDDEDYRFLETYNSPAF
ncbi:P-loop containing nucleoside triphosphate hydrolase protein [Fennellomyces sp. T-0311]|nr:P-loop containing nucleoside triphosphate hydrolase protein [Fennellomyces sp. T-0311]